MGSHDTWFDQIRLNLRQLDLQLSTDIQIIYFRIETYKQALWLDQVKEYNHLFLCRSCKQLLQNIVSLTANLIYFRIDTYKQALWLDHVKKYNQLFFRRSSEQPLQNSISLTANCSGEQKQRLKHCPRINL